MAPDGRGPAIEPSIFKAYDIRGVVGSGLTAETVRAIGHAIGSEARERGLRAIAVGRDGRLSGPELAEALGRGIREAGIEVIDVGLVPTPVLYYAACELAGGSGVMVTGSHNPPRYNGLKIMLGGETLSGAGIQRLRERIETGDLASASAPARCTGARPIDDYIRRVCESVRPARGLRVVVDCGNGAAGPVAPRLLRALGCDVVELFCDVDGGFPNHHPDPSQPENLVDLIDAVRSEGAVLGLAFDGDGDRLGVVDATGRIVWPDRQLMLYAADVLARRPGAPIIYDVKCSRHLERVIREAGGEPVMSRTGHSLIKARMKEIGAPLAGEMSGHIFFADDWYGFDDALYTAARLIAILARDERAPVDVFAALPDAVATPELRIDFDEDGGHFRFMERFLAGARFPGARLATIDGLRADFDDGWGLVRASNTTPSLIIRFEADTPEALARIQGAFRDALLAVAPDLETPF